MDDPVQCVNQFGRHRAFVQGTFPGDDAGMVTVPPDQVAAGLFDVLGESRIGVIVLPLLRNNDVTPVKRISLPLIGDYAWFDTIALPCYLLS